MSDSVLNDRVWDEPHWLNAPLSAAPSPIVWWLPVVYPAAPPVPLSPCLRTAPTPAAPPPTSTAAAMARRARILPIPRLLRLIIAASFDGRRPPRAPFRF